jgi:cyclopropane fatty-acyl-phospholipid synthase-like methyltransferase
MLVLAKLKPGEILYDLGAGDGRVVIMATQEFGAKALGVELRRDLVRRALDRVSELHLEERIKIVHEDILKINLSQADVITIYLTTSANKRLKAKLELELKPGARVVSHDYEIPGWKPVEVNNFCENPKQGYPSHRIFLYRK